MRDRQCVGGARQERTERQLRPLGNLLRCSLLGVCGALLACGGTVRDGPGGSTEDDAGASGGEGGADSAGGGVEGGGGATGGASSGGTLGDGVSWGGGLEPLFSHPALVPLNHDPAELSTLTGDDLLHFAEEVSLARGVGTCLCAFHHNDDPIDLEGQELLQCGVAESRLGELHRGDAERRCVAELSREIADVEQYLRCTSRDLLANGRVAAACPEDWSEQRSSYLLPGDPLREDGFDCEGLPQWQQFHSTYDGLDCKSALYCDDGTFVLDGRCNFEQDCPDLEDERDCADFEHPTAGVHVRCGQAIVRPADVCMTPECEGVFDGPLCESPSMYGEPTCRDGSIATGMLCNPAEDCAEGEDELEALSDVECL